jgi:hypothetical protein
VLFSVLETLNLVDPAVLARLEPLRRPTIVNHRQQKVGEMRALMDVQRPAAPAAISTAA